MLERFGLVVGLLVRFVFAHVRVRPELVERVRQLASQGGVIYVMRYRSSVDYLLVNAVLRREGLPLARFAPGVSTVWWRPLSAIVRPLASTYASAAADTTASAPQTMPATPAARAAPLMPRRFRRPRPAPPSQPPS